MSVLGQENFFAGDKTGTTNSDSAHILLWSRNIKVNIALDLYKIALVERTQPDIRPSGLMRSVLVATGHVS